MPPVRYEASTRWGAAAAFRRSHRRVGFETRFSGSDGNTICPWCPMWIAPLMSKTGPSVERRVASRYVPLPW